jgi:hypothetical protein
MIDLNFVENQLLERLQNQPDAFDQPMNSKTKRPVRDRYYYYTQFYDKLPILLNITKGKMDHCRTIHS